MGNYYRIKLYISILGVGIDYSCTRQARRYWQSIMAGFIVALDLSLFFAFLQIDKDDA